MSRVNTDRYLGDGSMDEFKVPYEISYSAHPKPVSGSIKSTYVQSSSSTTINGGQSMQFLIPNRGFLLPSSIFLKFKCAVSAKAGSKDLTIANSSVFFRRVMTSIGSVTIDNVSDYGHLYSAIQHISASKDYIDHDGNVLEGCGVKITTAAAPSFGTQQDLGAPLLGLLGGTKAIPLEICGSSLTVSIETYEPSALADISTGDLEAMTYQLRDLRLYYSYIDAGDVFVNSMRQQLAQVGLLKIPFVTFSTSSYSVSGGNTFNQFIAESCSSAIGVILTRQLTTERQDLFATNGFTGLECRADNVLTPNYAISGSVHAFAEMHRLLTLWDLNNVGSATRAQYTAGGKCVLGVSFKRYHDASLSGTGSPINQGLQIQQAGNTAGCTVRVHVIKEYELLISPDGQVAVRK